jgi:beta,beta-carotene 9',10'-dioxygenase
MRPGVERARIEKLGEIGFEFPATNYKRVNGNEYRFAWGASDGPDASHGYTSSIVKMDVRTGASTSFFDGEHVFGEPVFVTRPGGSDEDDGVLVSVGSRNDADTSRLVIIDAKTMELVASAAVGCAIPLGFHGSFIRASAKV